MLLNEEQISEIESMAELFFDIADIAVNIEVNPMDLRDEINSGQGVAFAAYNRGWFKGEIPLRKSIAQAAANGSNPAQNMLLDLRTKAQISNL
ncbi:MAG: hypothetical protein NTV01_07765 [Bacteroidia bacterium]|nr:hypothetical protein [Bacteroidia bacterium]